MEIRLKGEVADPLPPQWIVLPEIKLPDGYVIQKAGIMVNPQHISSVTPSSQDINGVLIHTVSGEEFLMNNTTVQRTVDMIRQRMFNRLMD